MAQSTWPFWKTVPRFDREYSLGDLAMAARALTEGTNEHARAFGQLFSLAGRIFFARSGRECLYLILKILGLPPGSRIGVPLYCCASVFEAIVAAGHVPVFLDIDLETYALSEEAVGRENNNIDALLVVHTFGYPANIGRLRACLKAHDIPIIEDCAHALFSEYEGRLTGTCSDASFFTFGMHKPAAAGGGGAFLLNNAELTTAAGRELRQLDAEPFLQEIRHSLTCFARGLSYQRSAYGALLVSPLGRYRDAERGHANGNGAGGSNGHFPPRKLRSVDRALLRQRIGDFRQKLPALTANTAALGKAIAGTSLTMPAEPNYGAWNHFMVPVRYETPDAREAGRKFLLSRRIDTAPLYRNCERNARHFGYAGGCPAAEQAAKTLCTVPNHSWLTSDELSYVGESLRLSAGAH
jgi:perosamine synthetase